MRPPAVGAEGFGDFRWAHRSLARSYWVPDQEVRVEKNYTMRLGVFISLSDLFLQFSSDHITRTSHLKKESGQLVDFEIPYEKI